jgi:hypothetical protein
MRHETCAICRGDRILYYAPSDSSLCCDCVKGSGTLKDAADTLDKYRAAPEAAAVVDDESQRVLDLMTVDDFLYESLGYYPATRRCDNAQS